MKKQKETSIPHKELLGKAADAYAEGCRESSDEMLDQDEAFDARYCGFTSGAEWEREQITEIAIEAHRISCFLHDAITGRCTYHHVVRKCDGNCKPMERFRENLKSLIQNKM